MNETELERLIVRLVGDTTQYRQAMEDGVAAVREAAGEIQDVANQIEGVSGKAVTGAAESMSKAGEEMEKTSEDVGKSMENAGTKMEEVGTSANNLTTVLGAGTIVMQKYHGMILQLGAAYAALRAQMVIINDFLRQEEAERKLEATLKANGREVESNMKMWMEWASEMQRTTTVGDEVALSMARQAISLGLNDEQVKRAVKNAQALAASQGGSAEGYIRMTAALEKGYVGRLAMVLNLRDTAEGTERVAAAQTKLAAMQGAVVGETEAFSGQMKQLGNSLSDVTEKIGGVIVRGLQPLVRGMKMLAEEMNNSDSMLGKAAVNLAVVTTLMGTLAITVPILTKAQLLAAAATRSFGASLLSLGTNPVAMLAILAFAVTQLTARLIMSRKEAQGLKEDMESLSKTSSLYVEAIGEGIEKRIGGARSKSDLEQTVEWARDQLEQAKRAQEAAEREGPMRFRGVRWAAGIAGQFGVEAGPIERQKAAIEAARKETDAWKAALDRANAALMDVSEKGVPYQQELAKAVAGLNQETRAYGLTQGQLLRDQFARMGATEKELKTIDWAAGRLERMKRDVEGWKSIQQFTDGVRESMESIGISSDRARIKVFEANFPKWWSDIARAAVDAKEKAQAFFDMMERGRQITRDMMTPQEKLREQLNELGFLWFRGAISAETYWRAVAKLNDAKIEAVRISEQLMQREAALAGSAEAHGRIAEFLSGNYRPGFNRPALRPEEINPAGVPGWRGGGLPPMNDPQTKLLTEIRDALVAVPGAKFSIARIG